MAGNVGEEAVRAAVEVALAAQGIGTKRLRPHFGLEIAAGAVDLATPRQELPRLLDEALTAAFYAFGACTWPLSASSGTSLHLGDPRVAPFVFATDIRHAALDHIPRAIKQKSAPSAPLVGSTFSPGLLVFRDVALEPEDELEFARTCQSDAKVESAVSLTVARCKTTALVVHCPRP